MKIKGDFFDSVFYNLCDFGSSHVVTSNIICFIILAATLLIVHAKEDDLMFKSSMVVVFVLTNFFMFYDSSTKDFVIFICMFLFIMESVALIFYVILRIFLYIAKKRG